MKKSTRKAKNITLCCSRCCCSRCCCSHCCCSHCCSRCCCSHCCSFRASHCSHCHCRSRCRSHHHKHIGQYLVPAWSRPGGTTFSADHTGLGGSWSTGGHRRNCYPHSTIGLWCRLSSCSCPKKKILLIILNLQAPNTFFFEGQQI